MFKKLIQVAEKEYKCLLWLFILFLINPPLSEGLSIIRVYPHSPHQGDVCILEIESETLPKARFGDRPI
ncbi:MAG: hypothetical protein D6726_03620, partial [Nitrospirae bacterium]